jgi:hypothetical protein
LSLAPPKRQDDSGGAQSRVPCYPRVPNHGKTLLVTFNNALVAYLRHLGTNVLGDVTVETYHKFGRGYLNSRGVMKWNDILDLECAMGSYVMRSQT